MRVVIGFAVLLMAVSLQAVAGPMEDADAAVQRRDYESAVRIVRPLAERGDPNAQYTLGVFYQNGLGVRQDRVIAYVWLSLAASQGRENAAVIRDLTARRMSVSEINDAKRLMQEWKASPH
jgi:TPR repeat protein